MGFLNKLAKGLHGSGVHVDISGPAMATFNQPPFSAIVTLTAKDEPKVVREVRLSLVMETTAEVSGTDADGNYDPSTTTNTEELLWLVNTQVCTLAPGVPVQVPFEVPLNGPGIMAMAANGMVNARMNALMNDQSTVQGFFESTAFRLEAYATVEGSHLHPRASQTINIAGATGTW